MPVGREYEVRQGLDWIECEVTQISRREGPLLLTVSATWAGR